MKQAELDLRFNYWPPTDDETRDLHQAIREGAKTFAEFINLHLPDGREKSLAITHCEEAMLWANAAVARGISADEKVRLAAQPGTARAHS